MSDDLVKRARDCANGIGSFKSDKGDFGLLDANIITRLAHAVTDAMRAHLAVKHRIERGGG